MTQGKYVLDYYRMTGEEYRVGLKSMARFFLMHNLRYMYFYRKYEKNKNIFYRYILYRYSRKYGLEISVDSQLGEGFYIGHPYNITVAGGVKIGRNVNIHKGCTIGKENRGKRLGVPCIGDNVYIGINAAVVGNIEIGNDVMIAPNSFVNFDVPAHSIVIGNPGVIYHKEDATDKYVGFLI